jgi:ubiquinone/menaquinone biosynthesis C-methylase UbiE
VTSTSSVPTGNTYDKYATTNPIERRLVSGFLSRLDRALEKAAPTCILEVGIGEGEVAARVLERFPDASLVGLDLADEDLARHWRSRGVRACFGDIARVPFPARAFDLVLAIEVLEHVEDPAAAMRELARVATGDVVLSVPREPLWRAANMARGKYLGAFGNTPGHIQHWSTRAFVRLVKRHFDVMLVSSPIPWTLVHARVR